MKTLCIYHSRDFDGWMSAAIVKKHFVDNHQDGRYIIADVNKHPNIIANDNRPLDELHFLGWDYGDSVPYGDDIKQYETVFMCDVMFPINNMIEINTFTNFVWIDHHKSSLDEYGKFPDLYIEGFQDTKYAACELTWKWFYPEDTMPEIVRLLGRYDCFGHKGTDEEHKVLIFQYGARTEMEDVNSCYARLELYIQQYANNDGTNVVDVIFRAGEAIYEYLCVEAKGIYDKAFEVTFSEPVTGERASMPGVPVHAHRPRQFLIVNRERFNPVNFGINYHDNGYDGFACFWYNGKNWSFSLYNDNGQVDCSAICKRYGGGGHKGAAGFTTYDLNSIIK